MTRITLDNAAIERLRAATQIVEICDESGAVVGTFVPAVDYSEALRDQPLLSIEELKRRAAEPYGRALSDILADLKSRWPLD